MEQKIKFNNEYPKLWGQRKAKLVMVEKVSRLDISQDYIEYDCKKSDGSYYILDKPYYIRLYFIGNRGIPFTTLRANPK